MVTKEPVKAAYERSDWCVVPAGAVAGEAMVALVLADAFSAKIWGRLARGNAAKFRQLCQTNRRVLKAPATAAIETPQGPSAARKIYPIVKYGDPVLEKPGAPVKKFDAELEQLAEDMFASMYAAQGVGLAAPQIGKSLRIAVVDVTAGKNPEAKIVLANPEIYSRRRRSSRRRRLPLGSGISRLRVAAAICDHQKRRMPRARKFEIRGENLLARAFCHEIDHLNGILFCSTLACSNGT